MPSSSSYRNSLVPNGGFGWFVVFGTALTNVFNQSLVSVFGLLYGKQEESIFFYRIYENLFLFAGDHIQNMGQGTVGAALVMNINSVALNFSGISFFYHLFHANNGFYLKMFAICPKS